MRWNSRNNSNNNRSSNNNTHNKSIMLSFICLYQHAIEAFQHNFFQLIVLLSAIIFILLHYYCSALDTSKDQWYNNNTHYHKSSQRIKPIRWNVQDNQDNGFKSLMVLLLLSSILFYEKIGRMKYGSFARKVREQWDMNTFVK